MSTSPVEILHPIREEAAFLVDSTLNVSIEQFIENEILKRAYVRAIEVIGEAAKYHFNLVKIIWQTPMSYGVRQQSITSSHQ